MVFGIVHKRLAKFVCIAVGAILLLADSLIGQEPVALERVRVGESGKGFVVGEAGKPFPVRGFNFDRYHDGRLLEDFWIEEWSLVEQAFRDMKKLGANATRIHLQVGAFMSAPDQVKPEALERLEKLIALAEAEKIYLNLTGLGCYHKQDVPAWYDALPENERWEVQANFWRAVAEAGKNSGAIFCYDLMNEPVVAAGQKPQKDWLGPGFAGKHYVQFINKSLEGRGRVDVAKAWIEKLVNAIREKDEQGLITLGLVDWSLDRPGLSSGFIPSQVAERLDFICVHIYPETGKSDEALEVLQAFAAVGKPVVIEEIFPMRCSSEELVAFLDRSEAHSSGIFTFFWGQTATGLKEEKSMAAAITAEGLDRISSYWSTR